MQFLAENNSPSSYNHLVESNVITQYPPTTIHEPPARQSNALFRTNYTSKTPLDQFDYNKHMLDNYLRPVHNDQVVQETDFINTRNANPYLNGEAARYYGYNENVPYADNYGSTDYWNPYINPGKNIAAYARQQSVRALDKAALIKSSAQNLNTFYPRDINPESDYTKNFNPSDNYVTGKNNFNMNNGNDIPLNVMHPNPTEMSGLSTGNTIQSNDVMNLSLKDLIYNLGKAGMDIINDLVKFSVDGKGNMNSFFSIFTKNDRLGYTGIYIIVITILMMILI